MRSGARRPWSRSGPCSATPTSASRCSSSCRASWSPDRSWRHAVRGGAPGPGDRLLATAHRADLARLPASPWSGSVLIGVGTIDDLSGWIKHGLLIDSWFDDGGGTGLRVSWTLVVEIAFYVLHPAGRRGSCSAPAAAGSTRGSSRASRCSPTGRWALVLTTQHHTDPWVRVLPPYLPAFAAGMLFAVAEAGDARGTWLGAIVRAVRWVAARPVLCWGLAAVALVAMVVLLEPNESAPAFVPGPGPHAAVVPPGGDRRAAAGAARAAQRHGAVPVEPPAGGPGRGVVRLLPLAHPGAARGAAAARRLARRWPSSGSPSRWRCPTWPARLSRRFVEAPARRVIVG